MHPFNAQRRPLEPRGILWGAADLVPRAHNQLDPRICAFHMCKRICAFLLCASGYVRTICAFNMCEPYVRLICAFFTNSCLYCFPLSPRRPPGTPQGACRRPPGSPQEPQEKAHISGICASSPGGPPLGASRGPPLGASLPNLLEG